VDKFICGVMTTLIILFVIYEVQTKDTGMLVIGFINLGIMCLVYGVNFGMFLEREVPSKKEN
jgi:hypothetical protein